MGEWLTSQGLINDPSTLRVIVALLCGCPEADVNGMRTRWHDFFAPPHRIYRAQLRPVVKLTMLLFGARWGLIGATLLLRPSDYGDTIYHTTFEIAPRWLWGVGFLLGVPAMLLAVLWTWEPPFRLSLVMAAFFDSMWGFGLMGSGTLDSIGFAAPVNWLVFATADLLLASAKEIVDIPLGGAHDVASRSS